MQNNKKKFIAVALISLFGLTACNDEVIAKPTGYDDAKIANVEDVYDNLMNVVYDSIRDGSLSSEVLDKVLYQYSLTIFGAYDEFVKDAGNGTTLKQAHEDYLANGGYKVLDQFILDHKAYWTVDNDGKRVDDEGKLVDEKANPSDSERARVEEKWQNIEERIAKKMYSNISSGSYSDRNLFYESRYLMSLRNSLKDVAKPDLTITHEGVLLDPDYEDVEVFDYFLTRDFYQSDDHHYIEEEIVPTIYNEMLVEQYILDEQYTTLGRSYARKVNVVSISSNSEYPLAATYLVNEFVDRYISGPNALNNAPDGVDLDTLKILSNAWKGTDLTPEEEQLIIASDGFIAKDIGGETVYLGTEYGDMMEDYEKINIDPYLTDSSIESDFTSSNTYPKEVGKDIKKREINLKDHTQNGWFIKNGGLSDLPETIRSRLFNVGVANALSELDRDDPKVVAQDRWKEGVAGWTYAVPEGESAYVALINGSYFLKSETSQSDLRDMVFYDNGTYYIVNIEEATSSSKLSKINDNRYAVTRGDDVMEEFVNEICEIIAKNDTYKTLSTKYWLEDAALKYHDTVVRDYFKSNYPELFE